MKNTLLISMVYLALIVACQPKGNTVENVIASTLDQNPAAEGFNVTGSDSSAIAIADEVMEAMGGRESWDKTRYLSWVFFGSRKHLWDKYTGDVRIESLRDSSVVLMNINNQNGRVFRDGAEVLEADSLSKYLKSGMSAWINDSYWLVMPFKLKDSGVTLTYVGEDTTQTGAPSDLLSMTFENVGVSPQNKYMVYVDKQTRLVNQWAFYSTAEDDSARFVLPWDDYKKYGNVMLSDNRGNAAISELQVLENIEGNLLSEF